LLSSGCRFLTEANYLAEDNIDHWRLIKTILTNRSRDGSHELDVESVEESKVAADVVARMMTNYDLGIMDYDLAIMVSDGSSGYGSDTGDRGPSRRE
jgi:hypothetical protein